jgi:seryl-tRNA synthetase
MTPQQLDQAFDRFMVAQARHALQLTDEQVPAFGPRLQRLQMTRRRAQRQRRQLVQQMTALSQNGGAMDDQTVAAKLKALDDQAARADAEIRQAYQEIDALLTPQQRLRFRAFEVRMEQRKLELISRAREAAGPEPPRAP